MMPSRSKTRWLNSILLLAFVHQLNACPCGCLEHNGWYQLGMSWLSGESKAIALISSADASTSDLSDADSDCDDLDFEIYVAFEERTAGPSHRSSSIACLQLLELQPLSSAVADDSPTVVYLDPTLSCSALELRAHFQILQI